MLMQRRTVHRSMHRLEAEVLCAALLAHPFDEAATVLHHDRAHDASVADELLRGRLEVHDKELVSAVAISKTLPSLTFTVIAENNLYLSW